MRHVLTELIDQVILDGRRVLHDVVQNRGYDAAIVQAHVRQDAGDLQGMMDVGLAAAPVLPLVGLGTEAVGPLDVGDGGSVEVLAQHL